MTSFDFAIEPRPARVRRVLAVLLHGAVAAAPAALGAPRTVALLLAGAALAGLFSTLRALPGPRHPLRALRAGPVGLGARLAGGGEFEPARLGVRSRVVGRLLFVEIQSGRRRLAWLLDRGDLPEAAGRRLRARIRLSC